MNRREFLKLTAAVSISAMLDSCKSMTDRFAKPKSLAKKNEKVLLKNANIIDTVNGVIRTEKHLLIQNEKIARLLDDSTLAGITAHREIDMAGAYIMPGLINMHCHITAPAGYGTSIFSMLNNFKRQSERNAEECIKHGVTTVRDMGAPLGLMDGLREKIAQGTIIGPRIIHSCGLQVAGGYLKEFKILNSPSYWNVANNPEAGREGVRKAVDGGAGFIKIFHQRKHFILPGRGLPVMDLPTVQAICDEASKHGLRVAEHHTDYKGFTKGLDGGVTTLEHMVADRVLSDEDIKRLIDKKIIVIPTMSVVFALVFERKGDPNWGKGEIPCILETRKDMMPALFKEFLEPDLYAGSISAYEEYARPESFEEQHQIPWIDPTAFNTGAVTGAENLRKLYAAGVPLGCGNDGGVPFIFPGALPLEMRLMEKSGMTTTDVLRIATFGNASIINMAEKLGSIEEGKIADLAVYEKNPLETVVNLEHPLLVFHDGELAYKIPNSAYIHTTAQ